MGVFTIFQLITRLLILVILSISTDPVNTSYHTKFLSLSSKKCMTQPTLIDLHPILTEDLNRSMFNMIRGIHESKTLKKHISCEYKCKFDGRKCNSNKYLTLIHTKWKQRNDKRYECNCGVKSEI